MNRKAIIAICTVLVIAWSVSVWWYGFSDAYASYIDQQRAKAHLIGLYMTEFVINSVMQDCWDINRQDEWARHAFLERLADKIIFTAGNDETILGVFIIARNGFIPWQYQFTPGNLPPESWQDIEAPIGTRTKAWGKIVLRVDVRQMVLLKRGAISNILSVIFILGTIIMLTYPWRWKRGRPAKAMRVK